MYQATLWSTATRSTKYLGAGCYGTVHDLGNGWVVKRGVMDGTLAYLEWCLLKQRLGEHMPGMPVLDYIVREGDRHYVCAMRKVHVAEDDDDAVQFAGYALEKDLDDGVPSREDRYPEHMFALAQAYQAYLDETFEPGVTYGRGTPFTDIHPGNYGTDENGVVVLFDPSGRTYPKRLEPEPLCLYSQLN